MGTAVQRVCASGGNGSDALIHQSTRTLTNAEILVFPTTAYDIIGSPGANRILLVDAGVLEKDFTAGAYTGGSPSSFLSVFLQDGNENSAQTNFLIANTAFTSANRQYMLYAPGSDIGSGDYLGVMSAIAAPDPDTTMQAVLFGFAADFDPGSGNAANTLTFGVLFYVWDIVAKIFLTPAESGWDPATRTFV